MLTHRIKLPDGTEIEFFSLSNDAQLIQTMTEALDGVKFPTFEQFLQEKRAKAKARKTVEQARKRQKMARRKRH